jgi:4-hydroxy-tetrahydrodipicolinate synthase
MAKTCKYRGVFTALVTPFFNGEVDMASFERLLDGQLQAGVSGVVVGGTTGESSSLLLPELVSMVKLALSKQAAHDSFKVIVSTGSNNTKAVIEKTLAVQDLGVEDVLVVTPYYNKPTPNGLVAHYHAIHDATNVNIILYDVPSRVVTKMSDAVIRELAELPRIKALKDCGGDANRHLLLRDSDIEILCGDDAMTLAYGLIGSVGCVSVTSNLVPEAMVALYRSIDAADVKEAILQHCNLLPLYESMFVETSPAPIKHALQVSGVISSAELRLPLVAIGADSAMIVEAEVNKFLSI